MRSSFSSVPAMVHLALKLSGMQTEERKSFACVVDPSVTNTVDYRQHVGLLLFSRLPEK